LWRTEHLIEEEGTAVNLNARGLGAILIAGLFVGAVLQAAEPVKPDHRIVLRVSSAMLNSMMDGKEHVNREAIVQEVILGTSVYGKALVTGTPVVKLVESQELAKFQIVLQGTSVARTTGYNGPAIVSSRSVTTFTATKVVVFEPGKGFSGQPAKVSARTQTTIENIDATRGRLIGRIIRRRAASIEASQHAQVEQIASQRAERRIQLAFDKASAARLAKLNEIADVRSLAGATAHDPAEMKYACCTTPHYFQIATSFNDSGEPMDLPKYDPANPANAPVELWVHDTLIGEQIANGIDLLAKQAENSKLALTVSAVAKLLTADNIDMIPAIFGKQTLNVHRVGRWRVAKMEIPAPDLAQLVQVLRPTMDATTAQRTVSPLPGSAGEKLPGNAGEKGAAGRNSALTAAVRTWTSGKYTALARFISLEGETVKLQRSSGVNTQIKFEKLSPADQVWIKQYLASAPRTASK
jgi:hypothetical protein